MSNLQHAIWWQVFPLGALGAPEEAVPDAPPRQPASFEPWLDYLVDLGCNGLLLGPIFESATHGYDTLDHLHIDRRLGGDQCFERLVAGCRERGIQILLDGVFNHVGRGHRFVTEAPEMLHWVDGQPRPWEGHARLVELDHSRPEVREFVVEVMLHWLRRGIAGWRLDVAYAVPTEFWAAVVEEVRREFPDAIFVGEVIHGDYTHFVEASHLDTVTQYETWKAIWSSIKDGNAWELEHALGRHAKFCERFVPQTFVGNHDVTRIASTVGSDGAGLAAAILLTLPGSPSIYYGDEQGFTGIKYERRGGDDEIRPQLPAHPDDLAQWGRHLLHWHRELIGLRRRHPWIATGRLEVTHTADGVIDYAVHGDGARIDVHLSYAERRIAIVAPDEELHFGG